MKTVFSRKVKTLFAAGLAWGAATLLPGCVGYYDAPYAYNTNAGYDGVYYNAGYYGGTYYPAGYYYPGTAYYPGLYTSTYYPSVYVGGAYYNRSYYGAGYYGGNYYNRHTYYRNANGTYQRVAGTNPRTRQVRTYNRTQVNRAPGVAPQRDYRRTDL